MDCHDDRAGMKPLEVLREAHVLRFTFLPSPL